MKYWRKLKILNHLRLNISNSTTIGSSPWKFNFMFSNIWDEKKWNIIRCNDGRKSSFCKINFSNKIKSRKNCVLCIFFIVDFFQISMLFNYFKVWLKRTFRCNDLPETFYLFFFNFIKQIFFLKSFHQMAEFEPSHVDDPTTTFNFLQDSKTQE